MSTNKFQNSLIINENLSTPSLRTRNFQLGARRNQSERRGIPRKIIGNINIPTTGGTAIGNGFLREVTINLNLTYKNISRINAIVVKNYVGVVTDTFLVTIKNITSSSITFNILRVDANTGWSGQFKLYYFLTTFFNEEDFVKINFEPFEDRQWYTLGRISDSNNSTIQDGWSGGAQEYWTNDSTGNEQIVNESTPTFGTSPYNGTQCWYAQGLYGFTTGSSFSPKLRIQKLFPMNAVGETAFNLDLRGKTIETIFHFKTAVSIADNSLFRIYNGSFLGNDRTGFNVNIKNSNAGGCDVYTFRYEKETGSFPQVNLETNLAYETWHKVTIITTYATDGNPDNDIFLYSINDGSSQNVLSWPNVWRVDNGFQPVYGTWLVFDDTGATNPSSGFYVDGISYRVL